MEEIKAHPFFAGINWGKLRDRKSPFVPEVKNSWDTANFDPYEEEEPWVPSETGMKKIKKKNTEFIGYTYKPIENINSAMVKALVDLDHYKMPAMTSPSTNGNLDYLHLEKDAYFNYPMNSTNRFKKDKPERLNKDFYATTTLLSSANKKPSEKDKFGAYYG